MKLAEALQLSLIHICHFAFADDDRAQQFFADTGRILFVRGAFSQVHA